jgi:hypothetical protein
MAKPQRKTVANTAVPAGAGEGEAIAVTNTESVAVLAYELWKARGCPEGSPDEDWFRAEEELRHQRVSSARAGQ